MFWIKVNNKTIVRENSNLAILKYNNGLSNLHLDRQANCRVKASMCVQESDYMLEPEKSVAKLWDRIGQIAD